MYNRKLNALCQYCDTCYFQSVTDNKLKIEHLIKELYEKVKDLLPFDNCVIDFAILPNITDPNAKALIVEINPFVCNEIS